MFLFNLSLYDKYFISKVNINYSFRINIFIEKLIIIMIKIIILIKKRLYLIIFKIKFTLV